MVSNQPRAIVTVAIDEPFVTYQKRLLTKLIEVGYDDTIYQFTNSLPLHSPSHKIVPYAFKAYALKEASKLFSTVLWLDSTIVPVKPLTRLWQTIENCGYWFSRNADWNCGQWTSDAALPLLGITREQAFYIPQVKGGAFALDLTNKRAFNFFEEYFKLAEEGLAFQGPWRNDNSEASSDSRVRGHRHDQTVMSVLANRHKMYLTEDPTWIVDSDWGGSVKEDTVLTINRKLC